MCDRLHPINMHANYWKLILWYLSIQLFDWETKCTNVIFDTSRSFLWSVMNEYTKMRPWFLGT